MKIVNLLTYYNHNYCPSKDITCSHPYFLSTIKYPTCHTEWVGHFLKLYEVENPSLSE